MPTGVALEDWTSEDTDALFEVILRLRDHSEAEAFFRDLCTRRELEEMAQRWAVARLLAAGHSYREIAGLTGSSTATVTRINDWRLHGAGGYRMMLERLGYEAEAQE